MRMKKNNREKTSQRQINHNRSHQSTTINLLQFTKIESEQKPLWVNGIETKKVYGMAVGRAGHWTFNLKIDFSPK